MKMTKTGANSVTLEWDEDRHFDDSDSIAVRSEAFNRATFKGHGRPTRVLYAGYGDDPWTNNPVEAVIELTAGGVRVEGVGSFGVAHKFWARPLAWAATAEPIKLAEREPAPEVTEDTRAVRRAATPRNGTLHDCKCGCETQVRSNYAQGHDARHVSHLVKAVVAGDLTRDAALAELPTENLKAKATKALDKRQS